MMVAPFWGCCLKNKNKIIKKKRLPLNFPQGGLWGVELFVEQEKWSSFSFAWRNQGKICQKYGI